MLPINIIYFVLGILLITIIITYYYCYYFLRYTLEQHKLMKKLLMLPVLIK